jgi:glycosyltransferase involved in cell wall biosynthesis
MDSIFIITALVILLYFSYPLWLRLASLKKMKNNNQVRVTIDGVTLILLSYNGKEYLEEKINILLKDLKSFPNYEMIIVDDYSTDGSRELLGEYMDITRMQIILKPEHKGIPHSMNLGVTFAKFNYLIFCDQRQAATGDILGKLVEPLGNDDIGAVSACISHVDKAGCSSLIRKYENFLKAGESRAGSLMGVYGPLYAMKKSCYTPIPEPIILDDLYLSLKVMGTKKIRIMEECRIYDEHICSLHDYSRIRRYLTGFLQILTDTTLLGHMPARQLIMLLWHKYLRLLIPVLLFLCYVSTGILSFYNPFYLIPFALLTILGISSLTPAIYRIKNMIIHFARINILYILAMGDLLFRQYHPSAKYELSSDSFIIF